VILRAVQLLWSLLLAYWMFAAWKAKPARQRESAVASLLRTALTVFVFVFLFSPIAQNTWLARRFLPRSQVLSVLGLALTAVGIGLAIWARYVLGRNWSAAITLKHSHELIRTGPYTRIRHPIYSGVILALIGTALVIGEWRALVAVVVLFVSWLAKARKEESLLAREFGAAFEEHRLHTGMFLPRLR
jgi:protein-S-isoprenylcysteine O-methyltransferase Ste14